MPRTDDDVQRLKNRISDALASGRLDAWQTKFLTDIQARLNQYGPKTRLSEKQRNKLKEVFAVSGSAPKPERSQQRPTKRPIQRQRPPYRKRRPRPWKHNWLVRKLARGAIAMLALVAAILLIFSFDGADNSRNDFRLPFSTTSGSTASAVLGPGGFRVTDGDTVQVYGERKGTRLVGFNTPETFKPRCPKEAELGRQATARVKELVARGRAVLQKVRCACRPGTEGTNACNFGRSCGILRVDGRDVGQILISEGLAVPFVCGRTSCPRTPRPWCN